MATEALNKFSACRLKAATQWPYAAPAIFACSIVERPECGGIVADKYWRLYFDPATVAAWSQAQIVGKILFEVSHLLRGHYKRFSKQLGFDPAKQKPRPPYLEGKRRVWAESAKLEIVDDFDEEHLELPDGMKRADDWNVPTKLLAEHYYARLQRQEEDGQGGQGQPQQQSKSKQQGGSGSSKQKQKLSAATPPPEGSAADGCPRDWEEPAPAGGDALPDDPNDQQSDIPGLSENEADMLRREVAKRINDHAKRQGSVPAGMRRWAAEVAQPRLDYRRIVMQKVNRAVQIVKGNKDYSYKRPSRRSPSKTVLHPSLVDHAISLVVIIDSSGSMNDKQLGEAVKIVGGILKALPRRDAVRVMAADAACYDVQKIMSETKIAIQGGGGTEMGLAIVTASNLKPRPDLVLVCSDGYTDWPKEMTNGVPCVAIIVSDGQKSAPSWIDSICVPHIDRDEESEAA